MKNRKLLSLRILYAREILSLLLLPIVLPSCGGQPKSETDSTSPSVSPSKAPSTIVVSGTVYERSLNTSYDRDTGPISPALGCDQVSLKDSTTSCDTSGTFRMQSLVPDYDTLSITASGYIPSQYTFKSSENSQFQINLGLYRTETVVARSGFAKGGVMLDLGNSYPASFWKTVMADPIKRMSANQVAYVDVGFNSGCSSASHTVSVTSANPSYPSWRQLTQAELEPMVSAAHSAGGTFNLWLGVVNVGACSGTFMWDMAQSDSSFWDRWFSDYRVILLERTQVAKNLGIEWITLGHTMEYVTRQAATRWASIINEMRALYPGIKIAYFGGVDLSETTPYFESDSYNQSSPNGFVSLLDALGHATTAISKTKNPSRAAIRAAFQDIIAHTSSFSVPIWIMPTTPSTTVGASSSTFMEPVVLDDPIALSYTEDVQQQADVYEGLFESINGTATGNGQVMGIFTWGYHLKNNYRDSGSESTHSPNKGDLAVDRTANIRGKPAEALMKWWFDRL